VNSVPKASKVTNLFGAKVDMALLEKQLNIAGLAKDYDGLFASSS